MENNSSYKLSEKTGIQNIIWIDDNFSSIHSDAAERDSMINRIISHIQDILDSGNIDIIDGINEFRNVNWELPYPVVFREVRDILTSTEINHSVILNQLCDETELNTSQLGIIKKTLESHFSLKTISLKDWLENKNILIESKKDTVFLIDRQFTNEGGSDDAGEEIIQEILNKNRDKDDSPACILFTQTCRDINEEERSRKEIYTKLKSNINDLQSSDNILKARPLKKT